jgi:hypothetical protein
MYRVITTFISESKTYSTAEEFVKEIEKHFNIKRRDWYFDYLRETKKLLNDSISLIDNKTLVMITDWIDEVASKDYIDNSNDLVMKEYIEKLKTSGITRTFKNEII